LTTQNDWGIRRNGHIKTEELPGHKKTSGSPKKRELHGELDPFLEGTRTWKLSQGRDVKNVKTLKRSICIRQGRNNVKT
jgi:hypothetical protein